MNLNEFVNKLHWKSSYKPLKKEEKEIEYPSHEDILHFIWVIGTSYNQEGYNETIDENDEVLKIPYQSILKISGSSDISDCWGLVPRVPQDADYDPKIWIWPVPSSSKRLGSQAPHTRHGPTTPGWRGGATNLKRTRPGNNP
jgi:hypothetical protein